MDVGGNMAEQHTIVGPARGEPLPVGRVGVRLRLPLSGAPSLRWSRDLSARLTAEVTGHPNVGHLALNEVVQGHEIVLEGVESGEAERLAAAVERAVDGDQSSLRGRTGRLHSAEAPRRGGRDRAHGRRTSAARGQRQSRKVRK